MHKNQKQRLIQQICVVLKFSQPAIHTTISYYQLFLSTFPEKQYSNEVIVCCCVFLVGKIFQQEKKIRDIFNAIYSVIKLYQMGSQQNHNGYIKLDVVVSKLTQQYGGNQVQNGIQPVYELTMYNSLKKQVLEAEQFLLKAINFDFDSSTTKIDSFKQLLVVADKLRLPQQLTQIGINSFNDLYLAQKTDDVIIWVPGIIYFSALTLQAQRQLDDKTLTKQIRYGDTDKVVKQQQSQSFIQSIEWQKLFLVPLKKLQKYSIRVIEYYQRLSSQQTKNQ